MDPIATLNLLSRRGKQNKGSTSGRIVSFVLLFGIVVKLLHDILRLVHVIPTASTKDLFTDERAELLGLARESKKRVRDLGRGEPNLSPFILAGEVSAFLAEFSVVLRRLMIQDDTLDRPLSTGAIDAAWQETVRLYANYPQRVRSAGLVLARIQDYSMRCSTQYHSVLGAMAQQMAGHRYGLSEGEAVVKAIYADYLSDLLLSTEARPKPGALKIVLDAGGGHAFGAVITLLVHCGYLQPGDHVGCQSPIYAPELAVLRRHHLHLIVLRGSRENNYLPTDEDLNRFESEAGHIKLLLICNPNNPSGRVLPEATVRRLAAFLSQRQVLVIDDTVYADLLPRANRPLTMFEALPSQTIVVHSISKSERNPGARFGAILYHESIAPLWDAIRCQGSGPYANTISLEAALVKAKSLVPELSHVNFVSVAEQWRCAHLLLVHDQEDDHVYRTLCARYRAFHMALGIPLPSDCEEIVPYYILLDVHELVVRRAMSNSAYLRLLRLIDTRQASFQNFIRALAHQGIVLMNAASFFAEPLSNTWLARVSVANQTESDLQEVARGIDSMLDIWADRA